MSVLETVDIVGKLKVESVPFLPVFYKQFLVDLYTFVVYSLYERR